MAAAVPREVARGQPLFTAGEPADRLFVVDRGLVATRPRWRAGGTITLELTGRGGVLGHDALLAGIGRYTTSATAASPSTVRAVAVADLPGRNAGGSTGGSVVEALVNEIERLRDLLHELTFMAAEDRVRRRLGDLAGAFDDGVLPIHVPVHQLDLATWCGLSRQTVNRVLRQLQADGAITLYRGGISVHAVDPLLGEPPPRPVLP